MNWGFGSNLSKYFILDLAINSYELLVTWRHHVLLYFMFQDIRLLLVNNCVCHICDSPKSLFIVSISAVTTHQLYQPSYLQPSYPPRLPSAHCFSIHRSFLHVLFIVSHAYRYLMNISREQLINIHIFCTRQGYEGENDATAILAWFIIKHLSFIISQAIIFTAQFDSYHLVCHLVIYY